MASCLVGLGSNLVDRVGNVLRAVEVLRGTSGIRVLQVSSLVESAPVGGPAGQVTYFNAAALIETEHSPQHLLTALLAIEQRLGRERGERWGPRTIDLDLLLYGEQAIDTSALSVPHPRMHERRFVLDPAVEIAAEFRHPRLGKTIGELLAALPAAAPGQLGLRIDTSAAAMQRRSLELRRAGRRIGLVPTMGALHEGHLRLVRAARERADVVVATIFVNPTQFGPLEDYSEYPRTLDADLNALSQAGCDLVFVPSREEMYPPGCTTLVEPPAVAQSLEGQFRPGHFRGVATVVLKLFNIIPAHVACFGQKDYQQSLVVRRMVADLNLPIEIVVCPIVREPDGLAMSSRNRYLSPAQRQQALALSRALDEAARSIQAGQRDTEAIRAAMRNILTSAGIERIDYVALADPNTLAETTKVTGPAVALIACHVGTTRLIDNRLFAAPEFPLDQG